MAKFPVTIIVRHRKENLKKCSLKGLEDREDIDFYTYPYCEIPDLSHYCMLTIDAPPLQKGEKYGLFLIDATWRLAETMKKNLTLPTIRRSLPELQTAYPRRQEEKRGLATLEALFAAYRILERPIDGLLDNYYWKDDFIRSNHEWFDLSVPFAGMSAHLVGHEK